MYDLMDKYGIVTWAEIPFVGPGGYADKGFVDQPSFRENGKEQLKEMIASITIILVSVFGDCSMN